MADTNQAMALFHAALPEFTPAQLALVLNHIALETYRRLMT